MEYLVLMKYGLYTNSLEWVETERGEQFNLLHTEPLWHTQVK